MKLQAWFHRAASLVKLGHLQHSSSLAQRLSNGAPSVWLARLTAPFENLDEDFQVYDLYDIVDTEKKRANRNSE